MVDAAQCRLFSNFVPPLPLQSVHSSCLQTAACPHHRSALTYRSRHGRPSVHQGAALHMTASALDNNAQRLLAIGGSGRVGQETLKALSKLLHSPVAVSIAARDLERGQQATNKLISSTSRESNHITFSPVQLDIDTIEQDALVTLLSAYDVVLHTAGPFQGRRGHGATRIAEAAISAGTFYLDVCDDSDCAFETASLSPKAADAGVIGITSAGIYPGISNLLVCDAISYFRDKSSIENVNDIDSVRLYYFTAGSGGIGATVLASTFLLLGEDADVYDAGGQLRMAKAASEPTVVDFGGEIGKRTTVTLRLPEVRSLHKFVAPNASITAKFATAPPIWNGLLPLMANAMPSQLLRNRNAMKILANVALPYVKLVDRISGATTCIVAEAVDSDGQGARVLFEHETLSTCVGEGTAAFLKQLLICKANAEDCMINPGIWFPEQLSTELQGHIIVDGTKTCGRLERAFL